jgi:hypothetical protein
MKVSNLLPLVGLVSAAVISAPPPEKVQTLPGVSRKDSVIKKIRYGPHVLKKAVVRPISQCLCDGD